MRTRALLAALLISGCGQSSPGAAPPQPVPARSSSRSENTEDQRQLAQSRTIAIALAGDADGGMFKYPQRGASIAHIWAETGGAPALDALLDDLTAPIKARLIAAEVLFTQDPTFLSRHRQDEIALVYCESLRRQIAILNAWGYLWYDGPPGVLADHIVQLGNAALPCLHDALDDRTVLSGYKGSEGAVIGNGAHFRVRDFAGYYLSLITRHPLGLAEPTPMQVDYALRDAAIDRLATELFSP